jgi:hypothetical protein
MPPKSIKFKYTRGSEDHIDSFVNVASSTDPVVAPDTPTPPGIPVDISHIKRPHERQVVRARKGTKYISFDSTFDGSVDPDVAEFEVRGTIAAAFLQKGGYSHTILLNLSTEEIDSIKQLVQTCPVYEESGFRWPIVGNEVKFTSKEDIEKDYNSIWDGRCHRFSRTVLWSCKVLLA